jgi:hypothetical protein
MAKPPDKGMQRLGDLLPQIIDKRAIKPFTPIDERLLAPMAAPEDVKEILYQHSVLCQTCMPYRDPGDDTRIWQRRNGIVRLELQAGRALDPSVDDFVDVGLPWGPKARLVLYHLNAEAMKQQTRMVEVEDSLTSFVRRTLDLDPKGRNIRSVKDQLSRLAAADFRLGASSENGRAVTVKSTIIDGFELWSPRNPDQKVLWPTIIQFSQAYFESLMQHAVPLNEDAIRRLTHTAMGLDIYTWLAQRLHRVDPRNPAFVPWASLKEQFGQGYDRMDNFKRVYRKALTQVAAVYQEAKYGLDGQGMRLHNSRPPVLKRYSIARLK